MSRAAVLLFCSLLPFTAGAAQGSAPAQADATRAARTKLQSSQGQARAEDANVKQLKARVAALEAKSQDSRQALEERDRKIAELERQLDAGRRP